MFTSFFITALLLIVCWSCSRFPAGPDLSPPDRTDYQKGMTFVCWSSDCYRQNRALASLDALQSTGADWISLIVTAYQADLTSSEIVPVNGKTPSDDAIVFIIDAAHRRGLNVMLKPHVDLLDGRWRGLITPRDKSGWFTSYRTFILHYARIAAEKNVRQFCVGTELAGTSTGRSSWMTIIADIRSVYHGSLTYAASWDEYEQVPFYDALDTAGINAFFPLVDTPNATLTDMLTGWEFWLGRMERWRGTLPGTRDVIITEIGYTSRDGTASRPYDPLVSTRPDPGEQADAYRATLITLAAQPWIKGLYWWAWRADEEGDPSHLDYTPRGKPAEEVLRAAWGQSPGLPL